MKIVQTYIVHATRSLSVGGHLGFPYFSDLPLVVRRLKLSSISGDVVSPSKDAVKEKVSVQSSRVE